MNMLNIVIKLNLWLTAPKGATPVNQTSATDWQMTARRDNVEHCNKEDNNNGRA